MPTRRRKMYQIKKKYLGQVKMEAGDVTTVLDEQTPQAVLANLYATDLGKGFIEQVAAPVAAPQTKDSDAKVG